MIPFRCCNHWDVCLRARTIYKSDNYLLFTSLLGTKYNGFRQVYTSSMFESEIDGRRENESHPVLLVLSNMPMPEGKIDNSFATTLRSIGMGIREIEETKVIQECVQQVGEFDSRSARIEGSLSVKIVGTDIVRIDRTVSVPK